MVPALILLIVLAAIVFLLYKSVQDARRREGHQPASGARPAPATPRRQPAKPRARPRARKPKPVVDEEALAAHVAKLREAVAADLISIDEAIASIIRQTDGALSDDAARKLLEQDDAA